MKRFFYVLLAILVLLMSLCACSAQKSSTGEPNAYPEYAEEAPAAAAPMDDFDGSYESYEPTEPGSGIDTSLLDLNTQAQRSLKLIYTAELTIETLDFESDYVKIQQAANAAGGYVSNETTYGIEPMEYGDSGRTTELQLRIPVENYVSFMDTLSGVGTVLRKTQNVDDVTDSYFDNDARIEMYEMRLERLQQHLAAATEMEDIILLEEEISNTLYTLDDLKGTKRRLDQDISLCTVNVTLQEMVLISKPTGSTITLGMRIEQAFGSTMAGLGDFLEGALVFLICAIPVLLVLAIVPGIVILIVALCRKNKKKKALQNPQPPVMPQTPPQYRQAPQYQPHPQAQPPQDPNPPKENK